MDHAHAGPQRRPGVLVALRVSGPMAQGRSNMTGFIPMAKGGLRTLLGLDRLLSRQRTVEPAPAPRASVDRHPWDHPFLTHTNIAAFREYSESVWQIALAHEAGAQKPLRCAFSVNMAQNMYKWACIAQRHGATAELFLHPQDQSALNQPEWEECDAEFADVMDGAALREVHSSLATRVPVHRIPPGDSGMLAAAMAFDRGDRSALLAAMQQAPGLRHEVFTAYSGFYPYFDWAKALSRFDTIYTASAPFAAYGSGRPYCAFSVGGDLQYDCGRTDDLGRAMLLAFNAARFLFASNPHTLGHSRRLGLHNGVYLPYPMDSDRYCPGHGDARAEWTARYGEGIYVLTTARLDPSVKGHTAELIEALVAAARAQPRLRFLFLAWGTGVEAFRRHIDESGMQHQFIVLPPVGKLRLIDYYRSCDVVLDQFVYGYYGATALEAASTGKPVVMKLRRDHYDPLYRGDVMPAINTATPDAVREALIALATSRDHRAATGDAMRAWLLRNHGEQRTGPLMLALLRYAADRSMLPDELLSPLRAPLSEAERAYHEACMVPSP
jgi:glycosyltransferase involved in cell wall biosynthesis